MTRLALALVVVLAASPALADEPAPTRDQLAAAKTAFDEAQTLYAAGKYHDAITKLESSYRLSRNAFLLYNIAHAYDQLGDKPKAYAFYLKFLELAAPGAAKRDESQKRADELAAAKVEADLEAVAAVTQPKVDKPAAKFADQFKHQTVDSAPPGKPVDIVVSAPREASWTVTLNYRAADEENYTSEVMTWRDQVLVGQIPATKVTGNALHYFIEVKDAEGNVVVRSGKRTSPNLVKVELPRTIVKPTQDDPLLTVERPQEPPKKLITPVSVSTTVAVVLLGGAITTYLIAKQKADDLEFDATACGTPPCQAYDNFDAKLENAGKRYTTLYRVTLGATVAAAGVAGYFWFRSVTKKKSGIAAARGSSASWAVVPALGDHQAGVVTARMF